MTAPEIRAKYKEILAQQLKLEAKLTNLNQQMKNLRSQCSHKNNYHEPYNYTHRRCEDCNYSGPSVNFGYYYFNE